MAKKYATAHRKLFTDLNPKLVPQLPIQWYEGKIQGLVKTWYENGVQAKILEK